MAASAPADSNTQMSSAIMESAAPAPLTAPAAPARAMPIDTAVAATAVDSASAAVAMNSTKAVERRLGVQVRRLWCPTALRMRDSLNIPAPRISLRFHLEIRGRCRRLFGRTRAKALTNKGNFMFLVNEQLTRERFAQTCGAHAT